MIKDIIAQITLIIQDLRETLEIKAYKVYNDKMEKKSNKKVTTESNKSLHQHLIELNKNKPAPRLRELTVHGTILPVVPVNSIRTVHQFLEDNKSVMYSFILDRLSEAIENRWKMIELFRVGNTPYIAKVDQLDYESMLKDAKEYYTDELEFEKADSCQHYIDLYHINNLIDSI